MPPHKRIQHLRSKNKLLLDKLESHSSQIEAELRYLKRSVRGVADKSPSGNDRCKNWVKRNNSLQVADALSSYTQDGAPRKCTNSSRDKNRKSTKSAVQCEDVNDDRVIKSKESVIHLGKQKLPTCCRRKLVNRIKSGVDASIQNSKAIRDIISSIDYSPKSTFLKKMKMKCKPYTREVYVKSSKETGVSSSSLCQERKKKILTQDVGSTPRLKARAHDTLNNEEDTQILWGDPLCSECGKIIKKQPVDCICVDGMSESKKLTKCGKVSQEELELERLKNFRERNWQDCHADPSECGPCHCCKHHDCGTKVYGISDRLFAVPIDQGCENLFRCSPCVHVKCQHSCCANSKRVVLDIPTTVLDGSAFDFNKVKNLKGAKDNIHASKDLLKKLKRPVPQNSMALRYQKGVC